jgi:transketolase
MPNLAVFRPADANETAVGWRYAMDSTHGPTGLVLSRQDLPVVTQPGAPGAEKGAYVLAEGKDVTLIATGSEVSLALAARDELAKSGVSASVVSMPCWELFEQQTPAYRASVLPHAKRVSIEAGVTQGWREWIGDRGEAIGIDRYGASAPGEIIMDKLGLNVANVVAAAKRVIAA